MQRWQYPARAEPVLVPPAPAVPELDSWAQPASEPARTRARSQGGWRVQPLEPSLTTAPPELSWSPRFPGLLLPAARAQPTYPVGPLEPSLTVAPPELSWGPGYPDQLLPASRALWLPQAFVPEPTTLVEPGTVYPDSWFQPASVPVLPVPRTGTGLLALPLEPSLTTAPPALSWLGAYPELLLAAEPPLWLPGSFQAEPTTLVEPGVVYVDFWFQPLSVPVLPAPRARTGLLVAPLEPSLTQAPPVLAWAGEYPGLLSPAGRAQPTVGPLVFEPAGLASVTVDQWWQPASEPVRPLHLARPGLLALPLEPSLTSLPPELSWLAGYPDLLLPARFEPWSWPHLAMPQLTDWPTSEEVTPPPLLDPTPILPPPAVGNTLGIAEDWRSWDHTQTVALESTRRVGPPVVDVVPVAKKRAIRGQQRSPSGGVYLGYEVNWHIPSSLLAPGARIRPGDVLVEEDGTRWTVLTTSLNRLGHTWMLGCVDLVLALDLRDTIAIERADLSYDAAGAAIKRFPTGPGPIGGRNLYSSLPARVQQLTAEAADQRGIRAFLGRYDVICGRPVPEVTLEDRVRWLDGTTVRYLDIRGVHNPSRIDELPVLDCELRP